MSLSVGLPDGGNARVSFTPQSDGTSVYYTEDKDIQWGLEHHYKYGKLFRVEEEPERGEDALTAVGPQSGNALTAVGPQSGPQSEEEKLREVTVSDMDDAKDYLSEHFGIVRTKLKREEQIREAAGAHGIVFKYR